MVSNNADSSLMADKKLYIETYGCQMNVADSEVVASIMETVGYSQTDAVDSADAVVPSATMRSRRYIRVCRHSMHCGGQRTANL